MHNEDFNEVAQNLISEVSTNRRDRLLFSGFLEEIRALWSHIDTAGKSKPPTVTTQTVAKKKAGKGAKNDPKPVSD